MTTEKKGPCDSPFEIDRQSPEIALILRGGEREFKSARSTFSTEITSLQARIAVTLWSAYAAP